MCVRLSDLFLREKKTHPDPERCFDYYYSIYTHTRIYNRSGERHLTLLWTFFFLLKFASWTKAEFGKDFFFFALGLDLFANRRKKKIQEREGFGAAPRSRISDVF